MRVIATVQVIHQPSVGNGRRNSLIAIASVNGADLQFTITQKFQSLSPLTSQTVAAIQETTPAQISLIPPPSRLAGYFSYELDKKEIREWVKRARAKLREQSS